MKIGLIRHFKVKRGYPQKLVTGKDLMNWVEEYDQSEVEETELDLGAVDWKRCYSSDLPRAKVTARKAFKEEIIYMKELREIGLNPLIKMNIKLPLFIHLLLIRVAWLCNHKSQPETKAEVFKRISRTLDEILKSDKDVLIVTHGGLMLFMRKELIKRGYTGPSFKRPENGNLYVFESNDRG
ncbi:histidine phosphatase family protein [Halalkalibacter urbisdiaboli]|uniref:histidine phosphatase family protein n=1 Tax=Halalkalibacter urbisdiaboli TaxID=1960589 RepID=UPI000B431898|nr:histidine phosphatase family protein [Halalkalibacter urbisdiaboli]